MNDNEGFTYASSQRLSDRKTNQVPKPYRLSTKFNFGMVQMELSLRNTDWWFACFL